MAIPRSARSNLAIGTIDCVGYTLLGVAWLVAKAEGDVQRRAARLIRSLKVGALALLTLVFVQALDKNWAIMHRWVERPYLFIFQRSVWRSRHACWSACAGRMMRCPLQ